MNAGPETFSYCPWSEIDPLSTDLIRLWNRVESPAHRGWAEDDYPAIVETVRGVCNKARADCDRKAAESARRDAEHKAAQRAPGTPRIAAGGRGGRV